ncbi:MAG: glycosyltransferase [Firmicutes bacterium]|nr:glycosyltransferase [Alicyclobacillaceae bacterium]MCL6497333.1 glycosyltransferase [Bacillota bacterium]
MSTGIGVALIARNEARFIGGCLESVRTIADEIVVVDTGSEDDTVAIARSHGARVIERPWPRDFGKARNWAVEAVSSPWILMLDADEVLVADDIPVLLEAVQKPSADAYNLRIVSLADQAENLSEARVTRLFRNDPRIRWEGRVHEQIVPSLYRAGLTLASLDVRLLHYGYLNQVMADRQKLHRNLDLLDQAIRETGDRATAAYLHWQRAQTLIPLRRPAEALRDVRRAMALLHPTEPLQALFWITLARAYAADRDMRKAYRAIQDGLTVFPDYTDLAYLEGTFRMQERDWERAKAAFWRAIRMGVPRQHLQSELGVGTFKPLWQLARIEMQLGHMAAAEAFYLKAIALQPAFRPAWKELLGLLSNNPAAVIGSHLSLVMSPAQIVSALKMWPDRSPLEEALLDWASQSADLQPQVS